MSGLDTPKPFPGTGHNHGLCVEQALARARQICRAKDIKLTALREAVLREIASSHQPVGAYDIIERVSGSGGRRLAPISVYRIIEVLLAAGLIHRIESLNAYFACNGDHDGSSSPLVLLCEDCGRVAETEAAGARKAIAETTEAGRFVVKNTVLEVKGICADCRDEPHQP
jgi:Fur family zinc uptake transcriptional regulator